MDIGGVDIIIPTSVSKDTQVRLALSFLRGIWPDGVMEQVEDHEFFFYQTIEDKRSWNKYGRTDANCNTMIHILPGDNQITMVFE